jgi:hypothetical protein
MSDAGYFLMERKEYTINAHLKCGKIGKDDRLTRQDFLTLARIIGIAAGDAEAAIVELAGRLAERAKTLQLPAFAAGFEAANTTQGDCPRP